MVITLPRQIIHATVRHAFGPHPRPLHRKCLRRSSTTPTGVNLCAAPNMVRSALRISCNYIVFSGLRALGFSCRSFWHSFPLFSMACGLFCRILGGGVPLLAASARPHLPQRNVDAGRTSNYYRCKLQVPGPWMKLPNSRHFLLWATPTPLAPACWPARDKTRRDWRERGGGRPPKEKARGLGVHPWSWNPELAAMVSGVVV